jgi:hypothetical protein
MNSVSDFASKINELTKNTASNILDIASLMTDAKSELSSDDFNLMLEDTKYSKNSSSIRKWLVIGKSYQRLMPISEKLPPNWSTIYKLSTLDPAELDLLEKDNIICCSITAREIDDALSKSQSKKSIYKVTISIDNTFDVNELKRLIDEFKTYQFVTKVSMNDELKNLI